MGIPKFIHNHPLPPFKKYSGGKLENNSSEENTMENQFFYQNSLIFFKIEIIHDSIRQLLSDSILDFFQVGAILKVQNWIMKQFSDYVLYNYRKKNYKVFWSILKKEKHGFLIVFSKMFWMGGGTFFLPKNLVWKSQTPWIMLKFWW